MTLATILALLSKVGASLKTIWTLISGVITTVLHWVFNGTDDNKSRRGILFALVIILASTSCYLGVFRTGDKIPVPLKPWKPVIKTLAGKTITVDSSQPVTHYVDRFVYVDTNGNATTVVHPPEGKVVYNPDEKSYWVQVRGLCFEPEIGVILAGGDSIQPSISARLLYDSWYGAQLMISHYRAGVGIDRRLFELGLMNFLISGGYSWSYGIKDHQGNKPYVGISAGGRF